MHTPIRSLAPLGVVVVAAVVGPGIVGPRTAVHLPEVVERQPGTLAGMHRRAALEVGEGERRFSVASIGRTEQREEGRVLGRKSDV